MSPEEREKERERKNVIYSGHCQGQRTHSARTKIPFIVATYVYACSQGQRTHYARTNFFQGLASLWRLSSYLIDYVDMLLCIF
jgi:hypothetical protein